MSNSYGRVNDYKCFSEYGNKYISLLKQSIKANSSENVIEYCNKLNAHGSYEYEAMDIAFPLAQEISNETIITTVINNCGYYGLNETTENMTTPVYSNFEGELTKIDCNKL